MHEIDGRPAEQAFVEPRITEGVGGNKIDLARTRSFAPDGRTKR
jgi:hypothetical protein